MTRKEQAVGSHNLYLDPLADGSKSYVWRGRVMGKPTRKVLRHPTTGAVATTANITLTEAKRIAKDMIADAANGGGRYFPIEHGTGITVRDAWDAYMKRDGSKLKSAGEKRSHWTRFIAPAIGRKKLVNVDRDDCADIIGGLLAMADEKGENGNAALNLQKNMKRFFNWCADEGYSVTRLKASPMAAMRKRPIDVNLTKRPARSLTRLELKWFFMALDRFATTVGHKQTVEGQRRNADATEALLRSMCRRNEVMAATWAEVLQDGLMVTADRAKNNHPILVPWSPAFRALIGDRPDDATDAENIFGYSAGHLSRVIEDVRVLMTEIAAADGFNGDFVPEFFGEGDGKERNPFYFTLHDFRDTAKTWMQDQRRADHEPEFSKETQEACLNHREKGTGAIYNAALDDPYWFYAQRKRAGEAWNGYLDAIKAEALAPAALAA
jgi:integrase